MRFRTFLFISIFVFSVNLFAFAGGDGSEGNPYQVSTVNDLQDCQNFLTSHFIQICDIDASETSGWNDGAGFSPIGDDSNMFRGYYDGQGYTIDGLYIDRPSRNYTGFFGKVRNCELQNIRFENCSITGAMCVGALAGDGSNIYVSGCYVDGTVSGSEYVGSVVGHTGDDSLIQNCSSNGSATSSGRQVAGITAYLGQLSSIKRCCNTAQVYSPSRCGGIAGLCAGNSSIQCCYNTGAIIGDSIMGGIVGKTYGTSFVQCYSTGYVSSGTNSGGLSGQSSGSSYNACFWNVESSYQSTSAGGIGLTRAEMNTLSTYTDAGWDFVSETANGTNDYWDMDIYGDAYYRYPSLAWEDGDAQYLYVPSGSGIESDPYRIESIEHLAWLSASISDWDAYFIQTCDIDAAPASSWHDGEGFFPIGNVETAFSGHYDGQGYAIDGLNINRPDDYDVALFGRINGGGSIENLHMTNVDITGNSTVGGLAGYIGEGSRVNGCSVTGNVTAQSYSGLLVASVYSGSTVSDSWAQGVLNVAGDYAGGIACSMSDSSSVARCYTDVTVSGADYVGGLIGRTRASDVIDCYSMGSATGENGVGGSIGYIFGGTLTNSFSTATVSGTSIGARSGGLIGLTYGSTVQDCYATGDVTQSNQAGGLIGSIMDTDVIHCYSTGSVECNGDSHGGMVGITDELSVCTDSFWNTESSGQSESHGGEGKTTAEMKSLYMYHSYGWDFVSEHSNGTADTWDIDLNGSCNGGYPVLSWETGEPYLAGPSGSGTSSSPYLIEQLTDLWWISVNNDKWSKVYLQTADIDATDTASWYQGNGLPRIGISSGSAFSGTYDGGNHTIRNLHMVSTNTWGLGLFSYCNGAHVRNLGVIDADVDGYYNVGVIAGDFHSSTMDRCYASGHTDGFGVVGGVVGKVSNSSISDSYNHATVHGDWSAGGFASWWVNTIYDRTFTNCYSIGRVTSSGTKGGFLGSNDTGRSLPTCFWDTETSGRTTSEGGVGHTTAEMKMLSTYIDAGWDFVSESDNGSDDYWDMDIYNTYSDGYPYLSWQDGDGQSMCVVQGSGTTEDPYLIGLSAELQWMSRFPSEWDKCFRQIADIDAGDTENWDNGKGFSPVGNTSTAFSGEYDGQGYSIDGLFIYRDSTNENGLFGQVTGGTISNLNVLNCNITGKYRTGAVVASCQDATIVNCLSSGIVSTSNGGGGIVGRMRETTIEYCGSSVDVSSYSSSGKNCGGLVGITSLDCVISNCYAHGTVEACNFCGGLIGDMEDTDIEYCYSKGAVTATSTPVGGLIGDISGEYAVIGCFWDTGTSGQSTSPAGTGKTTAEMQTLSTYTDAGWDFLGESDNGTDDIWLISAGNYPVFNDLIAPVITAIEDVPNDQGHQVVVYWSEAGTDTHEDPESCYKLYREVGDDFELVATIPDDGTEYSCIIATLADSSAVQAPEEYMATIKVAYVWSGGSIESATANGYSIDNIAPYATTGVTLVLNSTRNNSARRSNGGSRTQSAILSWSEVTEGGFGGNSYPEQNGVWYRVYAGEMPEFVCDETTLLGTTQNTSYEITSMDSGRKFFRIVVSDQP